MLFLLVLIHPYCRLHNILPSYHNMNSVLFVRRLRASLHHKHSYTMILRLILHYVYLQMVPRLTFPSHLIYIDIHRGRLLHRLIP